MAQARPAQVLDRLGQFWSNDQLCYRGGRSAFTVVVCGRQIAADMEPGLHEDQLHLDVDGIQAVITVAVTVVAPPPREPEPVPQPKPATASHP